MYKARIFSSEVSRYRILAAVIFTAIFLFTINIVGGETFGDTGYEMKTGQYILEHHVIPTTDIFSFSAHGAPWIAHYWLAGVIFYLINAAVGFTGLMVVVSSLAVFTYWIVLKTAWLKSKTRLLPLIILAPFSFLTYELWVPRPQIFSYLLTALLIFLLEKWRISKNDRLLFILPLLFILWANVHSGVVLGLLILCIYVGSIVIQNGFTNRKTIIFLATALVCFLAALINPNGINTLLYFKIIGSSASALHVAEWDSLLLYLNRWQAEVFFTEMLAAMVIVLLLCTRSKNQMKGFFSVPCLMVLLASALPVVSIRHVGLFPILAFPFFAVALEQLIEPLLWRREIGRQLTVFVAGAGAVVVAAGLLLLPSKQIIDANFLPVGGARFIQTQHVEGPMFNDPAFGGYLIWSLWPQQKVFIDGRNEVYSGKPTQDFLAIMERKSGWENFINKEYKFNYFILWYRGTLAQHTVGLTESLVAQENFKLVYWDDAAIILLRNIPENKKLIDAFGYEVISPFRAPLSLTPDQLEKAKQEIKKAIALNPDSDTLKSYAHQIEEAAVKRQ